jgi:alpha-tubulin suppressor-like RCC1 family protein
MGQLGADAPLGPVTTPVRVAGGLQIREISAGVTHSCARAAGRDGYCWGSNSSGELGDGAQWPEGLPAAIHPQPLAWDSAVVHIDAGNHVSCALPREGALHCWGNGAHGKLGVGTTITHARPQAVFVQPTTALRGDLVRFVEVSASGRQHTCAVTDEGAIFCWGESLEGALGNRYSNTSPVPQQVVFPERNDGA